MGTTAVSVLEQRLAEQIGDYLQVAVTTAIGAGVSIISTNLQTYDGGRDDYFIDWWVYITDEGNAGVQRQVSDYATATGTLTVRGTNLTDDGADLATVRLHRYNRDYYINAFNDAVRETFPTFNKQYDIMELVTGNILPNSHFRDWAVSTAPDKYSMQDANITATADTTGGNYRGGAKSMKATTGVGGAGKYVYISSDSYPRLLDLMGLSVSFYCWANPEDADDATIEIYTKQADGTAQTLTSTTTCPAGEFTLLKLESQDLNDDLVEIQFRFKIATASKYVYFDHARALGRNQVEYLLPTDIKDGRLASVKIQSRGYSDRKCDDIFPREWEPIYHWNIVNDGTDKFLQLGSLHLEDRIIRLTGYAPMSTVSAYTDTIEADGEVINRFIAYAKYKLYQSIEGPVSSQAIGRYESQSAKAYREYLRLSHISMPIPKHSLKLWNYVK
tara:strand:+ start:22395 stop:23729 length:1335 start_codon:yes stop_codon:yes gene_type:complete